ncbi:type III secretion system chaperone family protein [Flaviaesturariibacter terrae]
MLEKIFGWSKKKEEGESGTVPAAPNIPFGRYSDNNKPPAKVDRWNEAETLFKEQKIHQSIAAFFDYLRDDATGNVVHEASAGGTAGTFHFYQGSKIIRGSYNENGFSAVVPLAAMPQPSVPVMRRLLEMNFNLYYTRYAFHDGRLEMLFNSNIGTTNPSKLYYGLKELATKADKQDDLLVQDFTSLLPVDTEHIQVIPDTEKEVKYRWMLHWIKETLDLIETVDADKYSGGIAYLLLALAYRIDFCIVPEGKLLLALEKIVDIYFKKDDRPVTEKNQDMADEFQKLQARTREDVFPYLFRSKYTFSIVLPQAHKTISDAIYNANQNIGWYRDNKHTAIAAKISEYGFAYCQYSYSLPRPLTEYFQLFMMVNYPNYFRELGFTIPFTDESGTVLNGEEIQRAVEAIEATWKMKYPDMKMRPDKIKYDSLLSFNQSFTGEIEFLNMDTK